jgi:hypothetical protein
VAQWWRGSTDKGELVSQKMCEYMKEEKEFLIDFQDILKMPS